MLESILSTRVISMRRTRARRGESESGTGSGPLVIMDRHRCGCVENSGRCTAQSTVELSQRLRRQPGPESSLATSPGFVLGGPSNQHADSERREWGHCLSETESEDGGWVASLDTDEALADLET